MEELGTSRQKVNPDLLAQNPRFRQEAGDRNLGAGQKEKTGDTGSIEESLMKGIKAYQKTEKKFSEDGTYWRQRPPIAELERLESQAQSKNPEAIAAGTAGGSVSFGDLGESAPAGPKYDDGQPICEGDICADGQNNLAEVKKVVAEGLVVEIISYG